MAHTGQMTPPRTAMISIRPLVLCIATIAMAVSAPPANAQVAVADRCHPKNMFPALVSAVTGSRSFVLDDGREILLAAIESPGPHVQESLLSVVAGRPLAIEPLAQQHDRYGRLPARAWLAPEDGIHSLEAELLARGLAMVGIPATRARGTPDPCRQSLLTAEKNARAARLGLWSDPDYDIKAADNPAAILAARGRFAVVEGKVLSVRDSGGTTYVNFGRKWSEDFTVTILKRIGATFAAAGLEPKRLEGREVRVRGFVEERGGPWIEATVPEQFEFAGRR